VVRCFTDGETNYQDYLSLSKIDRDKYMKFQVAATVTDEIAEDLKKHSVDPKTMLNTHFEREKDLAISSILLKQMKYHCGKPLKITLTEKGPTKYNPIKDYFWRNVEYLSDYDYMIIKESQFFNMINEDFDLFDVKPAVDGSPSPFTYAGKLKNLDIYTTLEYPQKDMRMDEFDVIIGKKGWIESDLIKVSEDETEDGEFKNKYLFKMSFPVKRGFMRIQAKFNN